ncbi:flagellar assembly protein FliW [Nesterenkonia sp. NBAIMH1]|uniref:flagellar assembly protein FliW n=1 Tax=Nesterenkonia sp. NBAIMH1 TaxID=2600320 RepID=UPI00143D7168|nr:flagellar assembly protein FliW [Nesterenkonia sp. NBAIMH1]
MTSQLRFPQSLPGLAPLTQFVLSAVEGAAGLYSLEADELPELKLFLMDPALHIRDYAPDIRAHLSEVDAVSADQVRVLVVVNTAQGEPAANLLAPVLVNVDTLQAAQVILEGQDFPVRRVLTPSE